MSMEAPKQNYVRFYWLCQGCNRRSSLSGCSKPIGDCGRADYPTHVVRLSEARRAAKLEQQIAMEAAAAGNRWKWYAKAYRRLMSIDFPKLFTWLVGMMMLMLFWDWIIWLVRR